MYIFICEFLYVSDTSSHSANIPDETGYLCIIKSDCDLRTIKPAILKDYYEIKELLIDHDCEDIKLTEINEETYKEEYAKTEVLYINEYDL